MNNLRAYNTATDTYCFNLNLNWSIRWKKITT